MHSGRVERSRVLGVVIRVVLIIAFMRNGISICGAGGVLNAVLLVIIPFVVVPLVIVPIMVSGGILLAHGRAVVDSAIGICILTSHWGKDFSRSGLHGSVTASACFGHVVGWLMRVVVLLEVDAFLVLLIAALTLDDEHGSTDDNT